MPLVQKLLKSPNQHRTKEPMIENKPMIFALNLLMLSSGIFSVILEFNSRTEAKFNRCSGY